jgi:hypothetical protein
MSQGNKIDFTVLQKKKEADDLTLIKHLNDNKDKGNSIELIGNTFNFQVNKLELFQERMKISEQSYNLLFDLFKKIGFDITTQPESLNRKQKEGTVEELTDVGWMIYIDDLDYTNLHTAYKKAPPYLLNYITPVKIDRDNKINGITALPDNATIKSFTFTKLIEWYQLKDNKTVTINGKDNDKTNTFEIIEYSQK